jgi:hypothetical protein
MRSSTIKLLAVIAAFFIIAAAGFFYFGKRQYVRYEQYANIAMNRYASDNGISYNEAINRAEPITVYMGREICVGIAYRAGWLGPDQTYCISIEDNSRIRHVSSID